MKLSTITFAVLSPLVVSSLIAQSQVNLSVTNREPGIYDLSGLYKSADIVASVRILSGDAESYKVTIYKAEVIRSFKGALTDQVLFFGPYQGNQIGTEYLLFLCKANQPAEPKEASKSNYGTVPYYNVYNEGYSQMMTSYECIFHSKDPASSCDYAVRVCTDYIKIPVKTPTYPPMEHETAFGCRWVRKSALESLLEQIQAGSSPK